jgi:hypothetical protein
MVAAALEGGMAVLVVEDLEATWAASAGDSPDAVLLDDPSAGVISAGSASLERAGSMAAAPFSATAADSLSGATGIIAIGPITGARGATTETILLCRRWAPR